MASTGQPQSSLKRPNPGVNRDGDKLVITPLGAGNEVGRSCVFMTFKGKTIMVGYTLPTRFVVLLQKKILGHKF